MSPKTAANNYRSVRSVDGWFTFEAAMMFALIDEVQSDSGIAGDVFEIGVHHGKSAAFLGGTTRPGETLRVCDLFGSQEVNVSVSGKGDREVFEGNMRRRLGDGYKYDVFAKLSSTLDADEIGRGYRLFHIDGGHNADEALGDLRLADATTIADGCIIVDDPFRQEWPGVTEAIGDFLRSNNEWVPVVVGHNKFVMSRRSAAEKYINAFDSPSHRSAYRLDYPWGYKTLPYAGHDLRILYLPTRYARRPLWLSRLKKQLLGPR